MQDCISGDGFPDTRYIASPDFIATTLHYVTLFALPILAYGAYCILFKTPKKMSSVKWLMLNLHFWSSLSDLVMSFIGIPYILLPAPAGYGLGLLDSPRLMVYSMVTLLAALAAAVLAIYENRFFVLFARKSYWKSVRKPFLVFFSTMVPLIFVPPFFNVPEQDSARRLVLSQIPCQPPFVFKNREIFVLALDLKIPMYCVCFGVTIFSVPIILFGALIFVNLAVLRCRSLNSVKTMKIHRKFTIALTIQSAFLLSVVLAPVLVLLWVLLSHHHDQALNNFIFITLSLHGVGSTIMMLLAHKPYRDFTMSKLCIFSRKWNKVREGIRSYNVSVII